MNRPGYGLLVGRALIELAWYDLTQALFGFKAIQRRVERQVTETGRFGREN